MCSLPLPLRLTPSSFYSCPCLFDRQLQGLGGHGSLCRRMDDWKNVSSERLYSGRSSRRRWPERNCPWHYRLGWRHPCYCKLYSCRFSFFSPFFWHLWSLAQLLVFFCFNHQNTVCSCTCRGRHSRTTIWMICTKSFCWHLSSRSTTRRRAGIVSLIAVSIERAQKRRRSRQASQIIISFPFFSLLVCLGSRKGGSAGAY